MSTPIPESMYAWTRSNSQSFINLLWGAFAPDYYISLTGSILYRGHSYKDLDIIIYPSSQKILSVLEIQQKLLKIPGMRYAPHLKNAHCYESPMGRPVDRVIDVWTYDDKRVDFIILGTAIPRKWPAPLTLGE